MNVIIETKMKKRMTGVNSCCRKEIMKRLGEPGQGITSRHQTKVATRQATANVLPPTGDRMPLARPSLATVKRLPGFYGSAKGRQLSPIFTVTTSWRREWSRDQYRLRRLRR